MLDTWFGVTTNAAVLVAMLGVLAVVPVIMVLWELAKPGPRRLRPRGSLPWLGDTLGFVQHGHEMHDWIHRMTEELDGQTFALRCIGRPEMLLVTSPALFEDVYKTQFPCFEKGALTNDQLRDLLGNGISCVDGELWQHQRKAACQLFTMRQLRESMADTIRAHAVGLATQLERAAESGDAIDLYKHLGDFTIDVFAEIGFGVNLGCLGSTDDKAFQAAFDSAQKTLTLRFVRPSGFWKAGRWLRVGVEGQLHRDLQLINSTIYDIISKALANRTAPESEATPRKPNLVTLFIDKIGVDDNGQQSTAATDSVMLRDFVVNFLLAGRDTTAQSLGWFFRALTMHPHVVQKIRTEINEKLPSQTGFPTMEQVQELVYLEAAMKESLRLHPSAPINSKRAAHDTVLCDGTVVRKGDVILLPTYTLGRLESVWGADAKEFKPERWIDDDTGRLLSVSPFKFNAFHAGPRMCLGMNLALLEMKIVACGLLRKFDLEVLSPERVTYDYSLTLPIRGPLMTRIRMHNGRS